MPGGGDARLMAVARHLRHINGEMNGQIHRFAGEQGLHATDIQALAAILDAPSPLTAGRLGQHLGITSGSVTACLDRLEKAGHVRRVRDSADRRVVHLYYEPTARKVAADHFRVLARATERALERVGEDDAAAALRFLALLGEEFSAGGSGGSGGPGGSAGA
ncbi:MarR family winged helix-turn-helix transcriptional regulator [Streptomyces sp. H34-S5]|nr:MarR family winged helix-turn-helix transcriptional regulator [Streptomyces sp. H34-S5]MCZ4085214.1 MarR family winged helix-turn-helix transcriptional regulator [Streptomyces sp. H34-S5]